MPQRRCLLRCTAAHDRPGLRPNHKSVKVSFLPWLLVAKHSSINSWWEKESKLWEKKTAENSFVFTLQNLRSFDCRNLLLFLLLILFLLLQYFLLRFSLQQHCFIACHCHHLLLCTEDSRARFVCALLHPFFFLGSFRSAGMPRQAKGCST